MLTEAKNMFPGTFADRLPANNLILDCPGKFIPAENGIIFYRKLNRTQISLIVSFAYSYNIDETHLQILVAKYGEKKNILEQLLSIGADLYYKNPALLLMATRKVTGMDGIIFNENSTQSVWIWNKNNKRIAS